MINFSVAIDLDGANLNQEDLAAAKSMGFGGIFENVLNGCLMSKYKEGFSGAKLRSLSRIYKKLDALKSTPSDSIELEAAELDLIKEAFLDESIKVTPNLVRIYMQYQSETERCIKL